VRLRSDLFSNRLFLKLFQILLQLGKGLACRLESILEKELLRLDRVHHVPAQSRRLRLNLLLRLQNRLPCKLFPQQELLTLGQFRRTRVVCHGKILVPVEVHLFGCLAETWNQLFGQGRVARVDHDTAVAIPRVVAATVVDKGKGWNLVWIVVVFVINDPPIVFVMEIFVVVVDEMRRVLWILIKPAKQKEGKCHTKTLSQEF